MIAFIRNLFASKPKQTCFVYCPGCRMELCASESFVSDDERGVAYKCTGCGTDSLWDFDSYPVPVRMQTCGIQ